MLYKYYLIARMYKHTISARRVYIFYFLGGEGVGKVGGSRL